MVSNRRPLIVTCVFLTAFAAWFVADQYVGVAFYRLNFGETVEFGLAITVVSAFAAVIGASLLRSWRARVVEWPPILASLALLLAAEVAWRFIIAPLPMNGFKVAAAVMDVGTPIVALLGIAAAAAEWRGPMNRAHGSGAAAA